MSRTPNQTTSTTNPATTLRPTDAVAVDLNTPIILPPRGSNHDPFAFDRARFLGITLPRTNPVGTNPDEEGVTDTEGSDVESINHNARRGGRGRG